MVFPKKTFSPIDGALPIKLALVRPRQSANAILPILVTLAGIVTLVSPVQEMNASSPMLVTLEGIVMLMRPVQ